jgi:phosphonate transport system ATP-binding protein
MALIHITDLTKRFANGTEALRGVSLEVEQGSFVVILGPSGAGKSTLLRSINGLDQPTSGVVALNGQPLTGRNVRQVRKTVAMVFQHFNLVGRLNVLTNVLLGRLAHQSFVGSLAGLLYLFGRNDIAIAHRMLAKVGLVEKAWSRADQLSGGQQQRVGIARALAQQPQVVLADEPVASLDPVTGVEIMELLRTICANDGITMVVNLHQVDLARRYADRIVGLNAGRLVFDGSPAELTQTHLDRIYARAVAPAKEFAPVLTADLADSTD